MKLSELIQIIPGRNYLFEVVVPGKQYYPKMTAEQAEDLNGTLEKYFKAIARKHGEGSLSVNLYAKNGTTYKRREAVSVQIPADVDTTNEATTAATTVATTPETTVKPKTEKMETAPDYGQNIESMITKADIELVQVRAENKHLKEKVDDLKAVNKELARRNDEYYNENLRLTREHATEKDKRELEYKHKELDLMTKQKAGLNGLVEEIKTLPAEAWQFMAGLIPNHPMAKGLSPAPNENPQLNGTAKHSDPDAQACIEVIDSLLLKQSPEVTGMAALLVEHFVTHPKVLKAVYEKIFPQQADPGAQQTTTNN